MQLDAAHTHTVVPGRQYRVSCEDQNVTLYEARQGQAADATGTWDAVHNGTITAGTTDETFVFYTEKVHAIAAAYPAHIHITRQF